MATKFAHSLVRVQALLYEAAPVLYVAISLIIGQILGLISYSHCPIWAIATPPLIISFKTGARGWLCLAIGVLQGQYQMYHTSISLHPLPSFVSGKVVEEPRFPKGELISFVVQLSQPLSLAGQMLSCKAPYVPWKESRRISIGSEVRIKGQLLSYTDEPPFSYGWQMRVQGIAASCKVQDIAVQENTLGAIEQIRLSLARHVRSVVGDNERAGLILSTAFGFRDQLSLSTEEVFKRSGLSHILVASGYQVGMIFIVVFWFFRKISVKTVELAHSKAMRFIKWSIPILGAILYTLIIGAESSSVRAVIAVMLQTLFNIVWRKVTPLGVIVNSLLILSILSVGTILTPSTQLTFAALLGIAIGNSLCTSNFGKAVAIAISTASMTGTVGVIWFGQLSLFAWLANLLIAPALSVVAVNGTLLSIGAGLISNKLEVFFLRLVGDTITGFVEILDFSVPIGSLVEVPEKLRYLVTPLTLLPVGIIFSLWARRQAAYFGGITLRRRRSDSRQEHQGE